MSNLVRLIAALLFVVVIIVSIPLLFLVVSSNDKPMVAIYAPACLMAAFGFLSIARFPIKVASSSLSNRLRIATFMAIAIYTAIYAIFITDSSFVSEVGVAFLFATALLFSACIWPAWLAHSNPSFKRDSPRSGRAP